MNTTISSLNITGDTSCFTQGRIALANDLITRHIDEEKIPGAICVVAKDGQVVHSDLQGWSDMDNQVSLRENSLFRIYSMTKIITSAAILSLYDEGLIDLNDPVHRYLPSFSDQHVQRADGELVPASRATTLYDLLRHCGGIKQSEIQIDSLFRSDYTLQSLCDEIGPLPLETHPGENWSYGYSTDVLARIAEVVTGKPFTSILQQRIFNPLEMRDTGFRIHEAKADQFSCCYSCPAEGGLQLFDSNRPESRFRGESSFTSASGGLVSSTLDYLNFAQMLLNRGCWNGQQILSRKTVELMTMDHLPENHPNLEIGTQSFRFGLGVSVVSDVARSRCLSSLGDFGWGGAAGTQVWMNPQENLVVMIMIQVRAAVPTGIMDVYKRMVYQALS